MIGFYFTVIKKAQISLQNYFFILKQSQTYRRVASTVQGTFSFSERLQCKNVVPSTDSFITSLGSPYQAPPPQVNLPCAVHLITVRRNYPGKEVEGTTVIILLYFFHSQVD